jgi:hypothetical protein
MESIRIGEKVNAVRHDGNDVVRFRRELRNAGVDEQHHERVLAAARSANILNDQPEVGGVHDGMHAAANKQKRLEKLSAAATSNEPAIRSTAIALAGLLRRAGISMADVVVDDVAALDRVLASATKPMSVDNRLVCKNLLFRLAAI